MMAMGDAAEGCYRGKFLLAADSRVGLTPEGATRTPW